MKYETYAKLTPEQKEEYNFKFKKEIGIIDGNTVILSTVLILSLMAITVSSVTIYFIGTQGIIPQLDETAIQPVLQLIQLLPRILQIIILMFILDIVVLGYRLYKKHKWTKNLS